MSIALSLIAIAISLWSLYHSRRSLGRTYAIRATISREAAATCRGVGDTEGMIRNLAAARRFERSARRHGNRTLAG